MEHVTICEAATGACADIIIYTTVEIRYVTIFAMCAVSRVTISRSGLRKAGCYIT